MLNSTILATQSRVAFASKNTRFWLVKELLFALFLFSIKAKSNKEDETKIFYLAPYGVERPGYGGKAEYD